MPDTRCPIRAPLCAPANIPSQQWIAGSALSRNPSRFELREVRLEEADLMLSVDGRGIGFFVHNTEVIPDRSLVDCCCCLGDQFRSAHGLAVPEGSAIQGELGALSAACIGGVLV